ncbi:MAG: phosphopantothenoylcysteine decarboxylase, partial [Flavisolibacter sp.]
DYAPETISEQKIKKADGTMTLSLRKTDDILATLGARKREGQLLVGFALETNNEEANALKKLKEKNADLMVLNSLSEQGAGFGLDTNKVVLFYRNGHQKQIGLKSKKELAKDIVDSITELE